MKTMRFLTVIAIAVFAITFYSCSEETIETEDNNKFSERFANNINISGTLTKTDISGLMTMREEEKLARDVYLKFYEIHKANPFKNISKSENAHMSAVLYLINGYGLKDPALAEEGKFSTQTFTNLYNKLTKQGKDSQIEAYKVAAFIEEYDIADLIKYIEGTNNATVKRVYGNLLRGSENHIRAYTAALARLNETYTPTIISAELYNEILNKKASAGHGYGDDNGNRNGNRNGNGNSGSSSYTDNLTDEEKSGLLEMREEEKLAQDVYLFFYTKYNFRIFSNIAKAETAHTKAVLGLINGYGLEDPYKEGQGNFTNTAFTNLYKKLTEQGSASLEEALKVGAFIEEYDINDLINLIKSTKSENITRVYGNLLKGSKAHIKAFTRNLKAKGITYKPTILSEEVYNDILKN
jgi:hypothetical protein